MGRLQFTWFRKGRSRLAPYEEAARVRLARVTSAKKARSLPGSLIAGAGFDAAGDVDGVGADGEDGFGDVFRSEAAGEEDGIFCGGAFCDFPVGEATCAAEFF